VDPCGVDEEVPPPPPDVQHVAPAAERLGGAKSDGRVEVEPTADKVNDLLPEGGSRPEDVALGGAATDLGGAAQGGGQSKVRHREVEEERRLWVVR
jgi:hypothetical protein